MERNTFNSNMPHPDLKVYMKSFESPKERKELMKNMSVAAEFQLRHRGLFEYYGKDMIAYKLENRKSLKRNDFLHTLGQYMAYLLEDDCPQSWHECAHEFWEDLILLYYPHFMKVSLKQNETKNFLHQVQKFSKWLDKRHGTQIYPLISHIATTVLTDLEYCERLMNILFLRDFPQVHETSWDPNQDLEKLNERIDQSEDYFDSLFVVTAVTDDVVELTEVRTDRIFLVNDIPTDYVKVGIYMGGILVKQPDSIYWNWHLTDGIFPEASNFTKQS